MNKDTVKALTKCIVWGILWTVILVVIALILSKIKGYLLKDVLFIEGIIFVMLGIFASIGGNPMGLSLQSMGQNNAQFTSSANLEVSKMESEKTRGISKTTITSSLSTVSFIFAGIASIIINYII